MSSAAIIMLTGALVGASCALVGSFLVLRRMSLMGDAISHAVLLGIVGVFVLTGSRSALPVILGAGAVGLLTVSLVEAVHRTGRVKEDAAIGLVFPALFSVGVILVSRFPSQIHIDVEHVLYGEIAYTPFDRVIVAGYDLGVRAFWVLGIVTVVDLLFVLLLYKELKVATFDPGFAAVIGYSPVVIHYLLMAAVSATTVVAFDSVGAILVVAMLVVPAATAYLLTDRLPAMLALAVATGALSSVGGYWLARWLDGSIAGAMATVAGLLFAATFLASPRHGLAARLLRLQRLRLTLARHLLLTHLEGHRDGADLDTLRRRFLWSPRMARRVVRSALRDGLIAQPIPGRFALSERGARVARELAVG